MAQETVIHLEKYSTEAKNLVAGAQSIADSFSHSQVDPLHLLYKALKQPGIVDVFQKLGAEAKTISSLIDTAFERFNKSESGMAYLSTSMLDLLKRAEKDANNDLVGVDNLLNALTQEIRGTVGPILQQFSISPGDFRPYANSLKGVAVVRDSNITNNSFTRDLIARANNGEFGLLINRDAEVRRLLQILSRKNKNNPLLVADPGVGKSAIVEGVAQRFAKGEVAPTLAKMSLVELEIPALTSGAKSRSDIEERVKQVLNGFKQESKSAILVIDRIENLFNQSQLLNIADIFKVLLSRSEVRIFGTTTPENLKKINEKDSSFSRYFTILNVEAPTSEQAIEMLRGSADRYEKYHQINITDSAIVSSVNLAKRYIQDKCLPDSAFDILDEATARKKLESTGHTAEMDQDIRRLNSLKAQQSKLNSDTDPKAAKTLSHINNEIAELEPKVSEQKSKFEAKRGVVLSLKRVRDEYNKAREELGNLQGTQNFARIGELEHSILPNLKSKLDQMDTFIAKEGAVNISNVVVENDIAAVIAEWTGIPVAKMLEEEANKLLKMEERLTYRVVGQSEAVNAVSKAVRRSRAGLREARRPIGSFLFLGPSGVGKTELAKSLAELLFDNEEAITRFDCSEFGERHTVARLLGAPPGYSGAEIGGELVNAIKKHPYSVLLFDEVEKAHPDIFNILLALLDDGRVSSSMGDTADCSNTVVILTSNIGSNHILGAPEEMFSTPEGQEKMHNLLRGELKKFLRPEFINRLDNTIVFRALSTDNLRGILDIQIRNLEKLLVERELKIELTEEAKNVMVEISVDGAMGARPLKRSIIKHIQDPLTEKMLKGGIKNGTILHIDVNNNREFIFD